MPRSNPGGGGEALGLDAWQRDVLERITDPVVDRVVLAIPHRQGHSARLVVPCDNYRHRGDRQGYALGVSYVVPVCMCGADRADHEESAL
jgi:hypothetical protein